MKKTTSALDLWFCGSEKERRELSYPSFAHIYLKTYLYSARGTPQERKRGLLTPEAMTFGELSTQIDGLIRELETLRERARKQFARDEIK